MAEILIRVDSNTKVPSSESGDILNAFNNIQIKCCQAENICNVKHQSFNPDGLRVSNSLPDHYQKNTYEFKFERVSSTEVKRIKLSDMSEEVLSKTPNANGEAIDVEEFIKRRKKHARHRIFGTHGSEYWYGGNSVYDDSKLNNVWTEITVQTGKLESDHRKFNWGANDLTGYLALSVTDFTNQMGSVLTSIYDLEEGKMMQKRICFVPWQDIRSIAGEVKNNIGTPGKLVDIRDYETFVTEEVVHFKGLKNKRSMYT